MKRIEIDLVIALHEFGYTTEQIECVMNEPTDNHNNIVEFIKSQMEMEDISFNGIINDVGFHDGIEFVLTQNNLIS